MEKRWYFDNLDFIQELTEDQRAFFFRNVFKKSYPKNSVIFSPGDSGNLIYYVVSGRVKIYNLSQGGKEVIYWFCNPKDLFGLAELCGAEMRAVFAEAVEDTQTLTINKANFLELINKNPQISLILMRLFGSRIRQAHETIRDLVACDVPSRLAQLLIKLSQINGEAVGDRLTLKNKLTHQEMADMIGATRTTVTEIINRFKREAFLKYDSGKITFLNLKKLSELIDSSDLIS
jgi:CRP/FNR family transcriptional regulator, cyclic AMP receptor protein